MGYRLDNYGREPAWRPLDALARRAVPADLAPWLFDTASLTRRLQQLCRGDFRVRLIAQRWQRPLLNECLVLGMRQRECGLVRQVRLGCGRRPLVFARTVMPASTLRGARRFAHLGERPLGAMLFADKRIARKRVEIAMILPHHGIYAEALGGAPGGRHAAGGAAIWGRRSVFHIGGRPLLVSEIFLPTVTRHDGGRASRVPEC